MGNSAEVYFLGGQNALKSLDAPNQGTSSRTAPSRLNQERTQGSYKASVETVCATYGYTSFLLRYNCGRGL